MLGSLGEFLALASALSRGTIVPEADAIDISNGAKGIPPEVTQARKDGNTVIFVQEGNNAKGWYWSMPDNTRIYHAFE